MKKTTQKQSFKAHIIGGLTTFKANFKQHQNIHFVLFGIILAIMFLAPYYDWIPGTGATNAPLVRVLYYSVAALGLNLLLGFGGLISLAVAGFVGLGALSTALMVTTYGWPFEVAAIATLVLSGLLGVGIGLFSLKVEGIYLAIGTLFVGSILTNIFVSVLPITGDSLSIGAIEFLGRFELNTGLSYTHLRTGEAQYDRYFVILILITFLVLSMIIINNIIKSRTGRAFMAMSRSSSAAQAMGINIPKYRVMAFTISTMFASFGGILYLTWRQSAPTPAWGLELTLLILAAVVVGGIKSLYGSVIGTFVIFAVPQLFIEDRLAQFSNYLSDTHEIEFAVRGFSPVFAGLLIILVILFYPNGLVYIANDLKRLSAWLKKHILRGFSHVKKKGAGDSNG